MKLVGLSTVCAAIVMSFAPLAVAGDKDDQVSDRDLSVVQRPIYDLHPDYRGPLRVEAWTDHHRYRPGDNVQLMVKVNRGAYITVVDVGTSGRTTVLFPNRHDHNNWVEGGDTAKIPNRNDDWSIRVGGPEGIEIIKVFASTNKNPIYASKDLDDDDVFMVFRKGEDATRDLSVVLDRDHHKQWAEAVALLRIRD
jgi:hypothetical protein